MIANYTNHAANERTFLAWMRTGLAVAAFGFFLIKLNVFVDAVGGGSMPRLAPDDAGALVAVATRYAGLATVTIGIAIIARSSFAFERYGSAGHAKPSPEMAGDPMPVGALLERRCLAAA